jgi:hypothetical protein
MSWKEEVKDNLGTILSLAGFAAILAAFWGLNWLMKQMN